MKPVFKRNNLSHINDVITMEGLPEWSYYSSSPGIQGSLKEQIDDFIVKEDANQPQGDGDDLIFLMRKYNMTTLEAIHELSNVLHISPKRFGYAGNKDKRAITEQYVSVSDLKEEDLASVLISDIELEVVGNGNRINLGDLESNSFDVTIRSIKLPQDEIRERINPIWNELEGYTPHYFGKQRFGTRSITHLVGEKILKGEIEEAVWIYVAQSSKKESDKISKVRDELWSSRDPTKAAEKFPERYRYEKVLLYHLAENPEDYSGAIKRLPKGLQRLFIHAYQSYVFNKVLSNLIDNRFDDKDYEIPVPGYKTNLRDEEPDQKVKAVLEEDEVTLDDFKLRDFPSLQSEGTWRKCLVPVDNFQLVDISDDSLNIESRKLQLKFELSKGSYATSFLREFMKGSQ